jgi:hypothetical protein
MAIPLVRCAAPLHRIRAIRRSTVYDPRVRKLITWLAGLAGIAALLRRRSRARGAASSGTPSPAAVDTPDPAVELRQKLEETRIVDPARSFGGEVPVSLEERRARVHERAQEAIDLMHGSDDDAATDEGDTD